MIAAFSRGPRMRLGPGSPGTESIRCAGVIRASACRSSAILSSDSAFVAASQDRLNNGLLGVAQSQAQLPHAAPASQLEG
jgi:hypothetical protein